MSLLTDWREFAYSHDDRTREGQEFWIGYFNQEKAVYEQILATPEEPVSGTVTELAQKYNMELTYFVGFLDGINDSLKELYKEQRSSTTVVKPPKIGRNDPCPCGSGKKYKKCCGRN